MNEPKCIAGCKHFTGGEVRHHEDCPYYPESFSKMYDDLKAEVKKLNTQLVSKSVEPVREVTVCRHDWKWDSFTRVKKCLICNYAENY